MPVNIAGWATVMVLRKENTEPVFSGIWAVVIERILELQAVLDGAARDQHPMNFGGAVIDSGHPRIAVHPLERQILAEAHAAEHLDGAIDDAPLHLGRRNLDHRHLSAPFPSLTVFPGGVHPP